MGNDFLLFEAFFVVTLDGEWKMQRISLALGLFVEWILCGSKFFTTFFFCDCVLFFIASSLWIFFLFGLVWKMTAKKKMCNKCIRLDSSHMYFRYNSFHFCYTFFHIHADWNKWQSDIGCGVVAKNIFLLYYCQIEVASKQPFIMDLVTNLLFAIVFCLSFFGPHELSAVFASCVWFSLQVTPIKYTFDKFTTLLSFFRSYFMLVGSNAINIAFRWKYLC